MSENTFHIGDAVCPLCREPIKMAHHDNLGDGESMVCMRPKAAPNASPALEGARRRGREAAGSSSLDHYDQARKLVEEWADVFGADVPARINLTRRIAVLLHQAARHTPFTPAVPKEKK